MDLNGNKENYWLRSQKRFRRRGLLITAGSAATALTLAACGGDDNGSSKTPAGGSPAGGSPAAGTPAASQTQAAKTPKRGGALRVGSGIYPSTFDHPTFAALTGDGHCYNQLLKLGKGGKLMPDLAEDWETPDPTTFVFHLRKGVKFQDLAPVNGRELTAEDVVFTVERSQKPEFLTKQLWTNLASITAPDKYTVKATFKQPFAPALFHFATSVMGVLSHEVIDKFGDLKDPKSRIGTGPFMLTEARRDEALVYKRNPNYFEEGLPYLDEIQVVIIPDRLGRIVALRSGQIDLTGGNLGIADIEEPTRGNSNITTGTYVAENVTGFGFQHTFKPLSDLRVRQAISKAVDRKEWVRAAGGSDDSGRVIGFVHPFEDPYMLSEAETNELQHVDIAEAKKLMDAAGYSAGFELATMSSSADTAGLDALTIIQQQLQKIGIKVKPEPNDFATYVRRLGTKQFDAYFNGWPSSLDPGQNFHGNLTTKSPQNYWNANVPELDALDEKQIKETNPETRAELIREMERWNYKNPVCIAAYALKGWAAWNNKVMDYDPGRPMNAASWQDALTWLQS